jgi:Activator of Hsp90 ATPase homolog 1-like protein
MASEPAIITSIFEEAGDVTVLTVKMLFASKEARDGAIASGMTDGMEMSYAKLEGLFADAE